MAVALPSYISEPRRQWGAQREGEKKRLETLWPASPDAVTQGLAAWDAAHPEPKATVSDLADHIDHLRDVAGIDHIGLGGEYPFDRKSRLVVKQLTESSRNDELRQQDVDQSARWFVPSAASHISHQRTGDPPVGAFDDLQLGLEVMLAPCSLHPFSLLLVDVDVDAVEAIGP